MYLIIINSSGTSCKNTLVQKVLIFCIVKSISLWCWEPVFFSIQVHAESTVQYSNITFTLLQEYPTNHETTVLNLYCLFLYIHNFLQLTSFLAKSLDKPFKERKRSTPVFPSGKKSVLLYSKYRRMHRFMT